MNVMERIEWGGDLTERFFLRTMKIGGKHKGGKGRGKARGLIQTTQTWTLPQAMKDGHADELEAMRLGLIGLVRSCLNTGWIKEEELIRMGLNRNQTAETI